MNMETSMRYPNLNKSKIISFDIETYDPELPELGSGVYRRDGNILGIAISDGDHSAYYNLGHKGITATEKNKNYNYIKSILALKNVPKIGTGILYDIDWLENWGDIKVNGKLHDIQVADPLLDENQGHYSLEFLTKKYLKQDKYPERLVQFCKDHNLTGDHRKHLYLMPMNMVAEYAIGDAKNPIEIFRLQWAAMAKENLLSLYELEMGLYPLLIQMRKVGVRVHKGRIQKGIDELKTNIKKDRKKFFTEYGKFNYNSSKQLAAAMDNIGVMYPLTEKGNPNLEKAVLESMDYDICKDAIKLRRMDKVLGTFFINSFSNHMINGRIHCNFYPLKTGEYGTVSGRFSSANPNLQQIPSQDETFGTLCRSVFIPEEGCDWGKLDLSQIEYRLIAHFAIGPKSDEVRALYNLNPNTDYHQLIMDWTGLNRKDAKVMNFGMAYAMGAHTLAKKYNWSYEKAMEYIERYNEEVPFVKATRQWVTQTARGRGYIKTLLGRRARVTDLMRETRKEYIMFNRLIQGSSADLLKKAMYDIYQAGIYDVLIPHLTVHDELDQSIPKTKEGREAFNELRHITENCIKLRVPVKANTEIGPSWGELIDYNPEQGRLFYE